MKVVRGGAGTKTEGLSIGKLKSHETSRGVAYNGQLLMDGKEIGHVTSEGNGGYTQVGIPTKKEYEEFKVRMVRYFNDLGMTVTGKERQYSLEYTFAEHLLDYCEYGELSSTDDLQFLV